MSIPIMFALKDVIVKDSAPDELFLDQHCHFIQSYEKKKNSYEYVVSEHLRLSGVYWCLSALDIAGKSETLNRDDIINFVLRCQHSSGGFGASEGQDPHLLHTLSAVQVLVIYNALDLINADRVAQFITSMQQPDGSFSGDRWGDLRMLLSRLGEIDTRFTFCAIACLSLMNKLDRVDVKNAVRYVISCVNLDGGFGTQPGSESHAGQIYCCLGTLSIARQLHRVDADKLGWWLCTRQCPSGGLNGRPEKLPDVCYSWWVLASLAMLGRLHWIDRDSLRRFIFACQDESGGISDRPEDEPDPFHTLFGLAGLSLLGEANLEIVNPVFCICQKRVPVHSTHIQLLDA